MPIDDRTANRNYKLPNAGNFLADDVARLRDALTAIDADVFARYTKAETDQKLADLINGAPGALDTLNELAAAMGNDPNFATTITNALAGKPGFADVWTRAQADARYVQGVTQTENVFTGTGSQTTFALTQTPPTRESLLVTVDGVVQPTTAYNLSGSALILSEAPASGASIRVLMLGVAGPVQSASTLSFTQAGTGAVTRTVDSKLKDAVSVKDFGAKGDGVTDDTAAVQAAIDYALSQYQRVIGAIGGSFPVKKVRVVFPPGVYNTSLTLTVNGFGYQCVTLEGEGTATIRYTSATGTCIYLRPIDPSLPLMTTPVELKNLSIRKDDKASGSVGLVVERMSNCNFEALSFFGFQYAIQVNGAIDCDFDFKGQAIENCTFGMLIQQKTALGSVIKPNLTRIRNAYFINCANNGVIIRKNPDESAVNNGAGSVISIEDTNFQCACFGPAVSVESAGEVPNAGTVVFSRCWWEGHSLTAISLSNSQAVLSQSFITDAATAGGGRQIQLMDTASRITINELDAVFGVAPTQNAIVSRYDGTFDNLDLQVISRNVRISNPGIGSVFLAPNNCLGKSFQFFDKAKISLVYTAEKITAILAAGAGENVYDMGGTAGCYDVRVRQADGGIVWRASAEVFFNGASSSSVVTLASNNVSVTVSGSIIRVNNTNGSSPIDLYVTVLRVL